MDTDTIATLLDLEESLWRAAGDSKRYEERLAGDAVHVFPGRGIVGRDQVLAAVAQAEPWESFTIDAPRVVALGSEVVSLVYVARAKRAGGLPYAAVITSVYRRQEGRWTLVLHQQTPLARTDRADEGTGLGLGY